MSIHYMLKKYIIDILVSDWFNTEKPKYAMLFSSGDTQVHRLHGAKASSFAKYRNKLWKKAVCKHDVKN